MTKYSWMATFNYPAPGGSVTVSAQNTFETSETVSRSATLTMIIQHLNKIKGMPLDANVLFFSIEPDEVTR